MPGRFRQRARFRLERWIQRGPFSQILFMLSVIACVAVAGGILAFWLTDAFGTIGEAVWWAFLRLTDPGYLGDDEGTALRLIATVVTILGYVLFMGSLIAIMTSWLNRRIRILESGLGPISMSDHFLVLGWTNRTPSIVRELAMSEGRVARFLKRRGASRRLRIVILAEDISSEIRQELRDVLGHRLGPVRVFIRSGSALRLDHLRRVDYGRSSAIIISGDDLTGGRAESVDARVLKTLMSLSPSTVTDDAPAVVAEVSDAGKVELARGAYRGPLNVIAGDTFVGRLIVHAIRHRGLSVVFTELFSREDGNDIYLRSDRSLVGLSFDALFESFPQAVPIGLVRRTNDHVATMLNPLPDTKIASGDKVIVLARTFERGEPSGPGGRTAAEKPTAERSALAKTAERPLRRILLLGWSRKVSVLVSELSQYPAEQFEVDVLSLVRPDERRPPVGALTRGHPNVRVKHIEGDYTNSQDLAAVEWSRYDNAVFLANDWLETGEETDARSVLGYAGVRAILDRQPVRPSLLVELIDPSNRALFVDHDTDVIVSPVVLSHVLAHVALVSELNSVFSALFGPGGSEICFRRVADYGLDGKRVSFRELQRAADRFGEIAIGVRLRSGERGMPRPELNPPASASREFGPDDEAVVLASNG